MNEYMGRRESIAGPMRGIECFNFPAFLKAAKHLRDLGMIVFCPAERDIQEGFDPETDTPQPLKHYMEVDLAEVCKSDYVFVLDSWEKSVGANLEVHVANTCEIPVIKYPSFEPVVQEDKCHNDSGEGSCKCHNSDEDRITNPVTGGQKGRKLARFDLVPAIPLYRLAEHYGRGARKYEDRNWERGYEWSLSFGAMMRHAWAWWHGEELDEDTGSHHLDAVSFHAFALREFIETHPELDDRAKGKH